MGGRNTLIFAAACAVWAAGAAAAAPKEEAALRARHQALYRTLARQDFKALRGFYMPGYTAEAKGKKVKLNDSLRMMEQVFKSGIRIQMRAALTDVVIKGDTATALEIADLHFTAADGTGATQQRQRSRQGWKKDRGLWKLAWEKSGD